MIKLHSKNIWRKNSEPRLYPLTGKDSSKCIIATFRTHKQIIDFGKTILVQVDDGQGTSGSPATVASSINIADMSPQQAMEALRVRIGQIRRQLPQLNRQEQQLGQPGQMRSNRFEPAFDTSPFGDINTPVAVRPQTISDVQNSNISQQRSNLIAELEQLEATDKNYKINSE